MREVARSAPLPAAFVVLLLVVAPLVLFRLGRAVGAEVSGSVGAAHVAEGLVLGPLLAAAVAGATLAVAMPTRQALGQQIAAGPSRRGSVVVALGLVPAAVGSIVVVPSVFAVSAGLAGALPGGAGAGVALAVATLAGFPAGAVVAEGGLGLSRGQRARTAVIGAGGVIWLAIGHVLGTLPLGPLAPVPAAIRASSWPGLALGASILVGLGFASAWTALAATRAEARPRRPVSGRPARRPLPTSIAATMLLVRRYEVRLATLVAMAFGLAGVTLAIATSAPPPAPFLLGSTTTLLGSLICPLVVGGVLVSGRWLWQGAPVGGGTVARAFALTSIVAVLLPVAVVGSAAAITSGASAQNVGIVLSLVIIGSGVGVLSGALFPWQGAGAGDQMTTIAAFAAIAIATSLVVGAVAPRLVALGIPGSAIVVSICGGCVGAALVAVAWRLGASDR